MRRKSSESVRAWAALATVFWLSACAAPPVHEGYVSCRIFGHLRECVGVPMASKEADAAAKRFSPPAAGRVHIYLVRPYMQEPKKASEVFLNGKQVAVLGPGTYAMLAAPPGRNMLRVSTGKGIDIVLETEPGRVYYLQYRLDRLFNTITPRLNVLPEEDGQGRIRDTRRVFPDDARSDPGKI